MILWYREKVRGAAERWLLFIRHIECFGKIIYRTSRKQTEENNKGSREAARLFGIEEQVSTRARLCQKGRVSKQTACDVVSDIIAGGWGGGNYSKQKGAKSCAKKARARANAKLLERFLRRARWENVAKLTDKQKKKLIADYLECENYSEVARKYDVSRTTAKKIICADREITEKLAEKQEENTKDVLKYMEEKKDKVCELIGAYIEAMLTPEKIEEASVNQLSTALGTIIDKFTKVSSNADAAENTGVIFLPEAKKD